MKSFITLFNALIDSLKATVGPIRPRDAAHAMLLRGAWGYFGRLARRIDRLFARWQAGTLPKPRAPRPRAARIAPAAPPTYPRMPNRNAWYARDSREGRIRGTQLHHLLLTPPEFPAFLAAAPQLGRLLRPLCRMLDAPLLPALALPSRPPKPRPVKPRLTKPRPAKPRRQPPTPHQAAVAPQPPQPAWRQGLRPAFPNRRPLWDD